MMTPSYVPKQYNIIFNGYIVDKACEISCGSSVQLFISQNNIVKFTININHEDGDIEIKNAEKLNG